MVCKLSCCIIYILKLFYYLYIIIICTTYNNLFVFLYRFVCIFVFISVILQYSSTTVQL